MKRVFLNALAVTLALVVSFIAGELILRAVVTLPLPRVDPEVRYASHPVRRFTLLPAQDGFSYGAPASVGENGFRSNGSVGDAGRAAIVGLGDSFTFGLGVRDEETWPSQLQAQLRAQSAPNVRVMNAGTISYGVFQEMDLFRTAVLPLRPAVVVHALYWNDYMTPGPPEPGSPSVVTDSGLLIWEQPAESRRTLRGRVSWVASRSALLFVIKQVLAQFQPVNTSEYGRTYQAFLESGLSEDAWQPIDAFYRELLTLAADSSFRPFVVIMPVSGIVAQPNPSAHPYAVAARRHLEALGIPYLDAFALWERLGLGEERYFLPQGADSHLNAEGYRVIAEELARAMLADPGVAGALQVASVTR